MSKELTKEETLNYLNNELEGILPNNKIREIAERLCQNTKPLIDEIYGLSAKIDYLTEENAKLKASKSEANEDDILLNTFGQYCTLNGIKLTDSNKVGQAVIDFLKTRNNK